MNRDERPGKISPGGIVGFIEDKCFSAGLAIAFLMTIFISLDAASRYLLDRPISGGFEITEEYLMPALFFLAVSAVYKMGGHVRVTMFIRYIPSFLMRPLQVIMDLLGIAFSVLVAYGAAVTTAKAVQFQEYSISILAYPLAPAYAMALIGFGLLSIRLIISLFTGVKGPHDGQNSAH
ncbi:MAG: TRAP transporter small permease [Firmicutes bacterium]|nr:TRAP transporter small permease [Bacillota bacterium]